MISTFDDITEELTEDELKLVTPLINGLKFRKAANPIKAPEIVRGMNAHAIKHDLIKITDVRLRKLVNYIRTNSIAPIIATSKGYYYASDPNEIRVQIESLNQRARSILSCSKGLEKFL